MKYCAVLLISLVVRSETLEKFEILKPRASGVGKLFAYVDGRKVNLSTEALKAWRGWRPEMLLFTERLTHGREQLRAFNAITGARNTITAESLSIHDVTTVHLPDSRYALVLFMRADGGRTPWLALAHLKTGVFRRIPNATAGAIVGNKVIVHHFSGRAVNANVEDLQKVPPSRTETVDLTH